MDDGQSANKLKLLDLPVDVLKEIIKQLSQTNDLTSIALVHSALHRLAIPLIYNRFDIVWPDASAVDEPRGGVDALTYGLATLVMSQEMFGEGEWRRPSQSPPSEMQIRRKRGNYFSQHIRKFSIGNGPSEWVQEYMMNKECGKMLGTLVAVALSRMKNLDTFVWDMPTGILRDVWTSLSYLGDCGDSEPCKLEKVWVRCHRNVNVCPLRPAPKLDTATQIYEIDQKNTLTRVEFPSYSQLPVLKSLSVLDIDEMQYLDEISVLIGRSLAKLKELRIGISRFCKQDDWVIAWAGDAFEQIDLSNPIRSTTAIGGRRRGGVLGVLTSSFLDLKQRESPKHSAQTLRRRSGAAPLVPPEHHQADEARSSAVSRLSITQIVSETIAGEANVSQGIQDFAVDSLAEDSGTISSRKLSEDSLEADTVLTLNNTRSSYDGLEKLDDLPSLRSKRSEGSIADDEDELPRRLTLEKLDLEGVQLSIPVLTAALDWTMLTSLSLLDCQFYDQLWTALHDEYSKDLRCQKTGRAWTPGKSDANTSQLPIARLQLKTIHLNTVTPAFIHFIHDCLAPNTLTSLFLQEMSGSAPTVLIDDIFNAIIKRHRTSLRRLLLDSCKRKKSGKITGAASWRKWSLTTKHLKYLTSGKLPQLRELGFCIHYTRDWFYFIQRLPALCDLRALYIPRYSSFFDSPDLAPKELAEYILDALEFNPGMQLAYIGIADKCFEVLEGDEEGAARPADGVLGGEHTSDEDDDDDDDDMEDEETDDDDAFQTHAAPVVHTSDARDSNVIRYDFAPSEPDSDFESVGHDRPKLRIREILFYDDKVPIFRVRRGRL
ncbi:hypothetical protein K461DRAFT_220562 [Myriangium duriaei CBS 260.36]|uniref:F-box domain-containing protein n=1 Tax=Myriangium duriaei CBS 260.36 TaxID=1168546 RepID=A0A9P4JDR8_9PEZI|nr:hypothetical protein K461DRAFT_220562 [Myriangium duriaei CBS 260.36]